MRTLLFAALITSSLAGCKKAEKAADKKADKPPPTKPGKANAAAKAPADAGGDSMQDGDGPEEDVLRKDRKTGLGGADDKPEVLIEDLVIAIAEGKVPADRFVDPARGFIEHVILPGGAEESEPDIKRRICGKKAAELLTEFAQVLVKKQEEGAQYGPDALDHVLQCDNAHVTTDDPNFGGTYDPENETTSGGHPFKYAVCSSGGAAEWDANYELVFAPDATRGLRVVGMLVWESGVNDVPWGEFADEAIKAKGCK